MNILLLDDEPLALKMLGKAVSEAVPEANLFSFSKPREALDFAETTTLQVAFLDINMQMMDGLEVAKKLKDIYPNINIIFSTGYEEYALDALKLYSSGYLLKPIGAEDVAEVMKNLRFPIEEKKRLSIRCFGNFEAFCDGKPIKFKLSRTKELLAYLVDRNGAECRTAEIISELFEDVYNIEYYNKIRRDLIKTFEDMDLSDCIAVTRGGLSIIRENVDCDYFDYKDGLITTKPTEYMSQYSFAEYTFAELF
ncbi:MAG: response regulator [Ruminococcus sp.]|nr:response regulator [Ruminococcus sp.]